MSEEYQINEKKHTNQLGFESAPYYQPGLPEL